MKEYLQKFGKRSSSLDGGNASLDNSIDAWSLINEIKGKITKTVEEKFGDIKSEKKPSGSGRLSVSASKDSLNVSESEDCVQSLNLVNEMGELPEGDQEGKTGEPDSPVVGVLLPLGEGDSVTETKTECSNPNSKEKPKEDSDNVVQEETKRKFGNIRDISLRNKIRPKFAELRQRHIRSSVGKSPAVAMSTLCAYKDGSLEEFAAIDEEVESGVEAKEETKFSSEPPTPVNVPELSLELDGKRPEANPSPGFLSAVFGVLTSIFVNIYVIYFSLIVLSYYVIPMPAFLSGFLVGVLLTALAFSFLQWLWAPPEPKEPFRIPDYSQLPILSVPAPKEYRVMNRYQVSSSFFLLLLFFFSREISSL